MKTKTDASPAKPPRKPRLSLFFATVGGVGYLPKAPGTWGSLVGVLIYWLLCRIPARLTSTMDMDVGKVTAILPGAAAILTGAAVALVGVVAATKVAKFSRTKDPQFVVIDEVSGQLFTFLFALSPLNWKYLALGFILFRVFDIWKPFPVRQAESLPGGWGIMADDWIAAVYAAIGIWIARGLGL